MKTLPSQSFWSHSTLKLTSFVLETADQFKKRIQVELFAPPRQCAHCKQSCEVFVRPGNLCAPCWSYNTLSKLGKTVRKLAAAA
ncbi:MAG: hypothetical protein WBC25_04990 [Candidatus Acidiferrum sp.]